MSSAVHWLKALPEDPSNPLIRTMTRMMMMRTMVASRVSMHIPCVADRLLALLNLFPQEYLLLEPNTHLLWEALLVDFNKCSGRS